MGINGNFWLLFGNSTFSETAWGIKRIVFPAAYLMPQNVVNVVTDTEATLAKPSLDNNTYAYAGVVIELKKDCQLN